MTVPSSWKSISGGVESPLPGSIAGMLGDLTTSLSVPSDPRSGA